MNKIETTCIQLKQSKKKPAVMFTFGLCQHFENVLIYILLILSVAYPGFDLSVGVKK